MRTTSIIVFILCIVFLKDADAWRRRRRRRRSDPPPPPSPPPNTPPRLNNCPQTLPVQYTTTATAVVIWVEPTCTDSESLCTVSRSGYPPGHSFGEGTQSIAYTAIDTGGLSTSCTVSFTVSVIRCSSATSPQHCSVSCSTSNSVGSVCTYQCATGLTLSGSSQRVCQEVSGNAAQWTGTQPTCTDDYAPTVTRCPSSFVANRTEHWGVEGTFTEPTATDNFDQTLQTWTVPADLTSPYIFTADTACEYHFQDDAGNAVACTFDVEIHDTVVPEFLTCPSSQNLRSSTDMTLVTWDEPTCREIPGDEVRLVCNFGSNSVILPWGNNHVIYNATNMKNGLSEICDFYVNIEPMPCMKLRSPSHGAMSCDTWAYGRYCSMSCNENYDIPPPSPFQPVADVFTCGSSGQWSPTFYVPDCSQLRDPTKINLPTDLLYYSGHCGSPDALSDIAQSFIETIEKSIHSGICKTNGDCTVDNVAITCGFPTRRRRKRALVRTLRSSATGLSVDNNDHADSTTYDIEGRPGEGLQEIRISMNLGVGVGLSKADSASVKEAQEKLENLAREVLDIAVSGNNEIFNILGASHDDTEDSATEAYLFMNDHYIDCLDGYVAGRNNTTCVACTTGHYYDTKSRACHQCGYGFYQDEYGQVTCKSCDLGQSTRNKGSPSKTDCEDQCEAGQFSTSGLYPCIQCPLNTFQPLIGQTVCFECPDVKKTWNRGASDVDQCLHI
nr:sushi, von Willebrand factor type A, EGF and pentraxin domain-containing protein 1-like [Lytechinus pictus]